MRQLYRSIQHLLRVVALLILLINLAACRGNESSPPESEDTSTPEVYDPDDEAHLEANKILTDPLAEQILQTMFTPERDIAANGAVGPNQEGYLNIRPQADGSYFALTLGVARSDDALIERGVRALEFGLPYQKADGSFEKSSKQDVARFVLFGLRSYSLLENSAYADQYSTRLEHIFEALLRSDIFLLELLSQHPEIYEATNQVTMLAYVFIIGGQEGENEALLAKGDELLQWVLTVQREDGVFPELGGHDSHYQTVSLMALTNIHLHSENEDHQRAIYPALQAGLEWGESKISSTGYINDEGNTRTANDPSDSPEGKQINPREMALTFLYLSYLGPELSEARDLSEVVLVGFL